MQSNKTLKTDAQRDARPLAKTLGNQTFMNELTSTYKYPFGCIVFSVLSLLVFLIMGILNNYEWFSRGGSIIVLFGVASEFGLIQIQSEKINERINGVGSLSGPVIRNLDIPPPYRVLRIISHICVVIGTLIWGFGDWFLAEIICSA